MPDSGEPLHPVEGLLSHPPRPARLLTDAQIREAADRIGLLGGGYDPAAARYASYELHASRFIRRMTSVHGRLAYTDDEATGDDIVMGPRETVWIYSAESINLPDYIHADVQALGQLFAAGLCAGNTYVDPGSTGPIYLAITNLHDRAVRLPVGCGLARVQFFILGDRVNTVHGGPDTRRPLFVKFDEPGKPSHGHHAPDLTDVSQRLNHLESQVPNEEAIVRSLALLRASAVARTLWVVALAVLAAGVLSLTPALRHSPLPLRVVLVTAGACVATLAAGRTFFGGSVREWVEAAEARFAQHLEKKYVRELGIERSAVESSR